jgi:hypothetical protein
MRVAHQDLLLRLQSNLIVLSRVVTADTCTSRPTESIISKALAVELETATLATVAWLISLSH